MDKRRGVVLPYDVERLCRVSLFFFKWERIEWSGEERALMNGMKPPPSIPHPSLG